MKLIVKQGNKEQVYPLTEDGITIGRSANNTISLSDDGCSRNHCVVEHRSGKYWVTDLDSFNGTKVNGKKVKSKELSSGDKIQVGKTIFLLEGGRKRQRGKGAGRKVRRKKFDAAPFIIITFVFMGMWFIHKIYQQYSIYREYEDSYRIAGKYAHRGEKDKALNLLKEIIEMLPDTQLAKKATKAIVSLSGKEVSYSKQDFSSQQALEDFSRLVLLYRNRRYSPEQYTEKLMAFVKRYPEYKNNHAVVKEIDAVKLDSQSQIEEIFKQTHSMANKYLKEEGYSDAIAYYQSFARKYTSGQWKDKALQEVDKIYQYLVSDWQQVMEEIREKQNTDVSAAQQIAWEAYNKYKGTTLEQKAYQEYERLEGTAAKNRKSFALQEVKKFSKLGDWQQAIVYLQKRVKTATDKDLLLAYIRDFKRLDSCEKKLFTALRTGKSLVKNITLAGKQWRILTMRDKALVLRLAEERGTISWRWQDIPAETQLSMLQSLPFSIHNHMGIATFCMLTDLSSAAQQILINVLERGGNKQSIDSFYARWLEVKVPEKGFIVYRKRLITPEEKQFEEYRLQLKSLLEKNTSRSEAKLANELNAFHRRLQNSDLHSRVGQILGKQLLEMRQRYMSYIKQNFNFSQFKYLRRLKGELDKRRKHASELIFDEQTYPADETHGSQAQPEVNKRLASVHEIWQAPAKGLAKLSTKIAESKRMIQVIDAFLRDKYPNFYGKIPKEDYIDAFDHLVNGKLDIQNFAETHRERERIRENLRIFQENAQKNSVATDQERKQVKATNEYRHMMGLNCLRIDDKLTIAARKHSDYLRTHNVFAHVVPGEPEGAKPMQRTRTAGYQGSSVGENIYMGSTDAVAAHQAWINSAGHHRNILGARWRALGAGNSQRHWTQNFGNQ